MRKVPYIDYRTLSEYYTVQQVASLLRLSVREVAEKGKQFNIRLYRDDAGRYLLDKKGVKMLHYRLYHESKGRKI